MTSGKNATRQSGSAIVTYSCAGKQTTRRKFT